jgi:hypothetical protein
MSESGNVINWRCHPADENELAAIQRLERAKCMGLPLGSQEQHIKKIDATLAEVRKPPEQPPVEQTKPKPQKQKSAFEKSLDRGREKAAAQKAQSAQNPDKTNTKNHREERE